MKRRKKRKLHSIDACIDANDKIKSKAGSVLIVDQAPTTRSFMKEILGELGFTKVLEAEDEGSAMEALATSKCDLIIADWHMPPMMGIQLLRSVRANDEHMNIPFLLVAEEPKHEILIEAAKAGASALIIEPLSKAVLETKVRALVKEFPLQEPEA